MSKSYAQFSIGEMLKVQEKDEMQQKDALSDLISEVDDQSSSDEPQSGNSDEGSDYEVQIGDDHVKLGLGED